MTVESNIVRLETKKEGEIQDIRASLIGPDLFVPFREKKLIPGTWQQIVFLEFDVQPRDRQIIVHSMGE
ncbi:MAG TPA: YjbQ family protein [Candidatus Sulfotelmatobacter sp.]|jgi:thiamine phosphate synthase YjbQ (UPF0047 family)|nr:YjbQ family protein [Candidatus Sulfotelmatobacter sp.]